MSNHIIALLTDFGSEDGYAAAMKGRILSLTPGVKLVDVSHDIEPYNIRQAAFSLNNCYPYFPPKTIFVVVVDPGVGTDRHGLVIKTSQYYFVGPDNGVFSFIYAREAFQAYRIVLHKIETDISPTFHGRDVFAPIAAKIAANKNIGNYLVETREVVSFLHPPLRISDMTFSLKALTIDHFGNIIVNFHKKDWQKLGNTPNISVVIKDQTFSGIQETFGNTGEGELLLTWDSSGYLQIACNRGNAARKLQFSLTDPIQLKIW